MDKSFMTAISDDGLFNALVEKGFQCKDVTCENLSDLVSWFDNSTDLYIVIAGYYMNKIMENINGGNE